MRRDVMLAFRRLRPGDDVPRQRQHVRTDSEVCIAGRPYVDFKLQPVFRDQEIDGAAASEKIGSFADGQHVSSLNGFEYASVALTLRPANEKNVAGAQILFFVRPANLHAPAADGGSSGGLCQRGSERKVSKNAKEKRRLPGGESVGRPLNKSGKGCQERGFCLGFVEPLLSAA